MGIVLAKKSKFDEWNRFHKKNYLWWAANYCPTQKSGPSYISQIMNNSTNIAGNFIGFAMHITKLDFSELFYYDDSIKSRNFFGRQVELNGAMLVSSDYREVMRKIVTDDYLLDITA